METIAPPVVAVIVTSDPGDWFEETLRAFAAQDYPQLSVLVLDAGSTSDPTPVVAGVLPDAYVRRLTSNRGFGATANAVLTMVEGASLLLFCHDDVAPDPDAIHVMVEESFRSNAGIVAPKLVSWEEPRRLLHVGMAVDKGGAVVDRVVPGEIDHGQHDAVRDVFLAPGGCTLVRADLFAELGGFDPEIFAMGEDLDLCWRAQVLGARVVVAPGARVRHRELLAGGERAVPPGVVPQAGGVPPSSEGRAAAPTRRAALQAMQRRHELYAALKAYGPFHLVRVLPQIALLALAEMVVAVVAGHRSRAGAVAHAWRWNVAQRRVLRVARASVRAHRRIDDRTVRRMQLRGSARLTTYLRRAFTLGLRAANRGGREEGGPPPWELRAQGLAAAARATAVHDTSAPGAQAPSGEHGTGVEPRDERPVAGAGPATSTRWLVWLLTVFFVVLGTRQLIGPGFPIVGQLVPFPSWQSLLHRFVSTWQPTGLGTTDPTTPATGILGLAGMLLFGSVGLLQKVLVLGCIPVGALGMARLTRRLGTAWARITSTVVYLAIPVAYDALATGHLDALVVYAACPWIVHLLAQATRVDPYGPAVDGGHLGAAAARRGANAARRWRTTLPGWALALGVLDALATSLAPPAALVVVMVGLGLALGNVVVGGRRGGRAAGRALVCVLGASAVAIVLLAPWSFSVLADAGRFQTLAGVAVPSSTGAGWGELLRLAAGPIGDAALAWAFLAAAALPLLIGAGWRLQWAYRAWCLAVTAWAVAWLAGRGWLGDLHLAPQVLLVPAGVGVALAVGLGVSAFQLDLPGYRFGWRQAAAVTAAAAAAVGMLPVLGASFGGRWDLAPTGYGQVLSWMAAPPADASFRVLWLGDPRVLLGNGWQLSPGLAYGVSENGIPDASALWPGPSPGAAAVLGNDLRRARRHDTVRLGQLLAPYGVRYIVVLDSFGPSIPGLQSPASDPAPSDLVPALAGQIDLRMVISQGGFEVFANADALPLTAVRRPAPTSTPTSGSASASPPAASVTGFPPELTGWTAALRRHVGDATAVGRVPAGTVFDAVAPASGFTLTERGGGLVHPKTVFGYAPAFSVSRPGTVTVSFNGSATRGIEVAVEIVLWVVALAALAGRRRWLDWWWGRRRRTAPAPVVAVPSSGAPDGLGTSDGRSHPGHHVEGRDPVSMRP
jgi:GT2 family glycosyltransferase